MANLRIFLIPSLISLLSNTLTLLNFTPISDNTCTVAAEKPHIGNTGVPFINKTTSFDLISFLIFVGVLIYFKVPSIIAKFLDKRSDDIKNEIERASEILEKAKQILSSIEADHIKTTETIEQMVITARDRARDEEEKAKKHIEELMKNKLISAEGQVKSNERKIIEGNRTTCNRFKCRKSESKNCLKSLSGG